MSNPKKGDREPGRRFVALYHDEVDSMPFKTLSPAALWLLVQIRRAWAGTNDNIKLPFARVSWRLCYSTFDRARRELVDAGFVRIIDPGGLLKRPAIYALSEAWREKAKALAHDDAAGRFVNVRTKDGRLVSVWQPVKKRRASAENAALARQAKATKAHKKARVRGAVRKDRELQAQN